MCQETCRRDVGRVTDESSKLLSHSLGFCHRVHCIFSPSKWVFCIISIHIHAFSVPTWSCCTDRDKEAAIWSRPLSLPLNHTSRLSALMESLQLEPGPLKVHTSALYLNIKLETLKLIYKLIKWIVNALSSVWVFCSFLCFAKTSNEEIMQRVACWTRCFKKYEFLIEIYTTAHMQSYAGNKKTYLIDPLNFFHIWKVDLWTIV